MFADFLAFISVVMEEEQVQLPMAGPAAAAAPVNRLVKLPAFWPTNIAAWFASVDGVFELRGIVDQRARYFNVLAVLPEATVVLIADLVESTPLPADPFDRLRGQVGYRPSAHAYSEGGKAVGHAVYGPAEAFRAAG